MLLSKCLYGSLPPNRSPGKRGKSVIRVVGHVQNLVYLRIDASDGVTNIIADGALSSNATAPFAFSDTASYMHFLLGQA